MSQLYTPTIAKTLIILNIYEQIGSVPKQSILDALARNVQNRYRTAKIIQPGFPRRTLKRCIVEAVISDYLAILDQENDIYLEN